MTGSGSRTAKSARNIVVSLVAQLVVVVLGFVTRTVFIAQLDVAMVGVNSVLTSTLALFALADMGISGAVMYALYKPLRNGDTQMTAAIVRYASRLFRWVAFVVAVVGVAFLPFVDNLVRLEQDVEHLQVYYLVLLANTVVSYLMLNRLMLLQADQKIYLTKIYSMMFNVLRTAAQIVSLLLFESFLLFLVIQVAFTFTNNLFVYYRAGRIYPFVIDRAPDLTRRERSSIRRSIRAMLIYRVGGLVLNNSTPILVSVMVGTVVLGYYANYMLIVGAAVMIVEAAFTAITPGVGHLVASGDRAASRRVFDEIVLLAILVNGIIAIVFFALVDDFVVLWLGEDFVLPQVVTIAIALNFYVTGVLMPLWSFRSATGLFRQTRYVMLVTSLLSIGLAVTLAPALGLVAVVAAPTVARLATSAWYEPWLLIRDHLAGKALHYFLLQALALLLWTLVATGAVAFGRILPGGPLESLLGKAVVLMFALPLVGWLAFGRLNTFKLLRQRALALGKRV